MQWKNFRLIICFIVITIIASLFINPLLIAKAASEDVIYFPDSNLKKALIENGVDTNNDGEITQGEMKACAFDSINYDSGKDGFNLDSKGITDLTGLEYAVNIRNLSIRNNNIQDLSPLAHLKELQLLVLDYNNLSGVDLSPIMKLNKMKILSIRDCGLNNINAFEKANFPEIASLNLYHNRITDISPLRNLTNLRQISITTNAIEDISAVENFKYLTDFRAGWNKIKNLDALKNKPNLKYLDVHDNELVDISGIKDSVNLFCIELDNNKIKNIDSFKNLKAIQSINLDSNQIEDISVLKDKTTIENLYIGDNNIGKLNALENLTNLKTLSVFSNGIDDLSPIRNLTKLQYLYMGDNNISDISIIANFTELIELGLLKNPITDLSPIEGLSKLQKTDITEEHITEPSISGVEDGGMYTTEKVITYKGGKGYIRNLDLNWKMNMGYTPFSSGNVVNKSANYEFVVENISGEKKTIFFTIIIDNPEVEILNVPEQQLPMEHQQIIVLGVTDSGVYDAPQKIYFAGTGEMDGEPFTSGGIISSVGTHSLKVTGESQNYRNLSFTINPPPVKEDLFKGTSETTPSDWTRSIIESANEAGLLTQEVKSGFKNAITREEFCKLIIQLYEKKNRVIPVAASEDTFNDSQDSSVLKAYALYLIDGVGNGKFNPTGTLDSEQLVTIANKFLEAGNYYYEEDYPVISKGENHLSDPVTKEQAIAMVYKLYKAEHFGVVKAGKDFSLYVKMNYFTNDVIGNAYGVFNHESIVMPPHSALYINAGRSDIAFKDDYSTYNFGGKVLAANHSDTFKVIQPREIEFDVNSIYQDAWGSTGPYVRLLVFKSDFDENENLSHDIMNNRVLIKTDWQHIITGDYH